MAKSKITYSIDQKIKDYNKLIITEPNNPKVKELKADIEYFTMELKFNFEFDCNNNFIGII